MYDSQGMESEKDDFNIFVGDKYILNKLEITLSLMERRIEFSLYSQNQTRRTIVIRDSKGENPQNNTKRHCFQRPKKWSSSASGLD